MASTSKTVSERHSSDTRGRASEGEETFRSFFKSPPFMMGIIELLEDDILHVADNPSSARFFGMRSEDMANHLASELGIPPESIRIWSTFQLRSLVISNLYLCLKLRLKVLH